MDTTLDKIEDHLKYFKNIFNKSLNYEEFTNFDNSLESTPQESLIDNFSVTEKIDTQISKIDTKLNNPSSVTPSFNANNFAIDTDDDLFDEKPNWLNSKSLNELYSIINKCQNCPLGSTRTNFVFGSGNIHADIMFIGEAPGADEDAQGLPFVGRAGQLLTKIIEAINFKREDVYIANIIKCRPPGNRQPLPSETNECQPYLAKQIELIKPKFIVLLGLTAADTFFKSKHKMAEVRGNITEYKGISTMITYHPAALLYDSKLKRPVWEDMKKLRDLYDELKSK